MQRILLTGLLLFASSAFAQSICNVTYTVDIETADGKDVSTSVSSVFGMPMADVLDNSSRSMRVVDLASKQQDKGGPYTIELGEVRACDGKPPEKVAATSIEVKGVTLAGANRITRKALDVADQITKRYEDRAGKGQKHGWDHDKARKVKRNDLGQKVRD